VSSQPQIVEVTQIEIGSPSAPLRDQGAGPLRAGSGSQTRTNDRLGTALIVLLALVPLPFGSVYGFSWGVSALFTGLASMTYAANLIRNEQELRVPLRDMRVQAILFAVFCAYLVVQIVPFGAAFGPMVFATGNGQSVTSNTLSISADATLLMLLRQLTYGAFFFMIVQVCYNDARRRLLMNAVLIIIAAYAAYAVVSLQMGDTVLGIVKRSYQGSATGTFVNRNSFATFLALGTVIALAQVGRRLIDQFERHAHDGRVAGAAGGIVLYGLLYILLLAVVIATQSKMGLFATLAGSAVVAGAVLVRSVLSPRALLSLLLIGIGGLATGLFLFGESLFDRVIDIAESGETRADLYAQVIELIRLRPLTGFGGGTFELAFPLVHQLPVTMELTWERAHDTYLSLWSELGLIAGSLPIVLFGYTAIRLVLALRSNTGSWMSQTVALAALVLAGVHSLADFSLELQANTFFFLALIAAGLTTAQRSVSR
jgi:O-antigen ligase